VSKDDKGFFKLQSARSDYVVRLPVDYDAANPKPYPMVVGMHGCGDNAYNFGTWAVTTFDGRSKQDYIAISIGGRDGQCWSTPADEQIVFAAIEDVRQYIYAHDRKITLAGFSSGGALAYYMGLKYADRFAGLLVQHSAIPGRANAIKNAPRKIAIAATGAMSDNFFPPATYNADWAALRAAGFPLETREKAGGHDGTSDEWRDFLLPKVAGFVAP
jgi:predicted esterase